MTHITRTRRLETKTAPTVQAESVAPSVDAEYPKHQPLPPDTSEYPKSDHRATYAVLDALSDVVCVTTADGTLLFLNRAGRDLLAYEDDDALLAGCLFPAHTPAARVLMLDEVVPTALERGEVTCDTALQTSDGRIFPARQTVIATPADAGRPTSLTIVFRDVSIERQAAAQLGESQRLFETIARKSSDLIYLYDSIDERIVWMSRCAQAFLGGIERDARTLSRRELHRLVDRADRPQVRDTVGRMATSYSDSDVLTAELRMRSTAGTWRWIHTRISVFSRRETGAPLLMLGIATDITARKKAEQRLIAERDAAELASLTRGEFVAQMTDEFRSALHAMIGLTSEVRRDRDRRLTVREIELLDNAVEHGLRLLETVSDLHDFSAIESGGLAVEQSLIDVRELIRATVTAFADHPAIVDTPLRVSVPDQCAASLTDAARLRQALTHLLAHALASPKTGPITVALVVSDSHRPIAIEVSQPGAIDTADHDAPLSQPFARSARQTIPTAEFAAGTGLGLALARSLCEMIGCTLELGQPSGALTIRIGLPVPSRGALLASALQEPGNG